MDKPPYTTMTDKYEYDEVQNEMLPEPSAGGYLTLNTSISSLDIANSNSKSSVCSDDLIDRNNTCSGDFVNLDNNPTELNEDRIFADTTLNRHYTYLPLSYISGLYNNEETYNQQNDMNTPNSAGPDSNSDRDEQSFTTPIHNTMPIELTTYYERLSNRSQIKKDYERNAGSPNATYDTEEDEQCDQSSENDSGTENASDRTNMRNRLAFKFAVRRYVSRYRKFMNRN